MAYLYTISDLCKLIPGGLSEASQKALSKLSPKELDLFTDEIRLALSYAKQDGQDKPSNPSVDPYHPDYPPSTLDTTDWTKR